MANHDTNHEQTIVATSHSPDLDPTGPVGGITVHLGTVNPLSSVEPAPQFPDGTPVQTNAGSLTGINITIIDRTTTDDIDAQADRMRANAARLGIRLLGQIPFTTTQQEHAILFITQTTEHPHKGKGTP